MPKKTQKKVIEVVESESDDEDIDIDESDDGQVM